MARAEQELLVITEDGYGKRTPISKYRRQRRRGGQGVVTTGAPPLAAALIVRAHDELVVATVKGQVIRLAVADVPRQGRAARGARVVRLRPGDRVAAVTRTAPEAHED